MVELVKSMSRFYLIVDSSAWLERLLPLGVKFVQLRIKDQLLTEVRHEIRRAKLVCEQHGAQLIVNDYWQLAIEEACDFVHLGQSDLDTADINAMRHAKLRIGISTHDHCELERALALQPDYVALGPIYQTVLKKMPWAPQGLQRVAEWKQRIGALPLVAIGGLTVERANDVFAAGANIVAVVTDVLRHADPEARVREWLTLYGES